MKTFTEKRFFDWREDEVSVTLRNRSGSYGGGSEVLVLESNQNHATVKDTEICTTLPASMGLGGGYVPMISCIGGAKRLRPWMQVIIKAPVHGTERSVRY